MKTRATTQDEKKALEYLNSLRNSGAINMFGARPYIQKRFGIELKEAGRLLTLWMDNFNEESNYETIKLR